MSKKKKGIHYKKCRSCGTTSASQWHGEKGWFGWKYWCSECYRTQFVRQVISSPQATAKYVQIYGRMPTTDNLSEPPVNTVETRKVRNGIKH